MRLTRLSLVSSAACLLGLLLLAAHGVYSTERVREANQRVAEMAGLKQRIDALSAGSDSLVLHGADPHLLSAFLVEARAIRARLQALSTQHPSAGRAVLHVDHLVDAVLAVYAGAADRPSAVGGPLEVPLRARVLIDQVAGHGVALDAALDVALGEHRAEMARGTDRIVLSLAIAALLFGALCVVAFGVIHQRLGGPVARLAGAIRDISAGHPDTRARVSGNDEFAELAGTFNDMLDRLQEQSRLLRVGGRVAHFGGWSLDLPTRYFQWSDVVADVHGMARGRAPSLDTAIDCYAPQHRQRLRDVLERCAEQGRPFDEEFEVVSTDGPPRWVRMVGMPVRDAEQRITRIEGSLQDMTDLRAARTQLLASNAALADALRERQALINSVPAHIALLDASGTIVDVNEQWRHFGEDNNYTEPDHGVGRNYLDVCALASDLDADEAGAAAAGLRAVLGGEQQTFVIEYPCHSPSEQRWFRLMANRLVADHEPGSGHGAVVMHINITERKLAELELLRAVGEDRLTGQLNRHGFVTAFNERTGQRGWQPDGLVLAVDLEGLRTINDSHGYDLGDAVLVETGQRLRALDAGDGLVGRVGGDEFMVYLPPREGEDAAARVARLAEAIAVPLHLGALDVEVAVHLGYSRLGEQRRSIEHVLREAELALAQVRDERTQRWMAYSEAMGREVHRRVEQVHELRAALDAGDFELHYQPKVILASGELVAAEALLRWNHPRRGLLAPGGFIEAAEQSRLIGPIGDWVLFEACRQLRAWQDEGLEVVRVSVNVSLVQFRVGDFAETVRRALTTHGVDADHLTLEITESVFERQSMQLRTQLEALRALGVRLSLDDFGTGYSSLLYLKNYHFNEIKVDQGFVRSLLDEDYSRSIVASVLAIAAVLRAEVVAEGVETAAMRDVLLQLGCRFGQGYYYSAPLAAEDFRWLLQEHERLPVRVRPERTSEERQDHV